MGRRQGLLALTMIGAIVVGAGCSSGRSDARARQPTTTAPPARPTVELEKGQVTVEAVRPGAAPAPDVVDGVMAAVGAYVDTATTRPLATGRAGDLAPVFTGPALARLAGPDRGVVLDEALPTPTRTPRITTKPVALTVLVDADGRAVLATAALSMEIAAVARPGSYTVRRTGELTLAPAAGGGWQVAGYDFSVARDGPGLAAGGAPAAGPAAAATPADGKGGR